MTRSVSHQKIAVITSAHGVRGQVKIRSFLEDPESLFSYGTVTNEAGSRQFSLKRHGIKDRLVIASIDGISDRNEAELLKGTELYASVVEDEPEENRWSVTTLSGMEARTLDGNVYGRIVNVYNFGAGDILEIEFDNGITEMLPFNDDFVGGVHPEEGYLVVFPPDYTEGDSK